MKSAHLAVSVFAVPIGTRLKLCAKRFGGIRMLILTCQRSGSAKLSTFFSIVKRPTRYICSYWLFSFYIDRLFKMKIFMIHVL
jgi:hypothetical protein